MLQAQVPFATNKTRLDIYYQNFGHELPHELSNYLSFKALGNYKALFNPKFARNTA